MKNLTPAQIEKAQKNAKLIASNVFTAIHSESFLLEDALDLELTCVIYSFTKKEIVKLLVESL